MPLLILAGTRSKNEIRATGRRASVARAREIRSVLQERKNNVEKAVPLIVVSMQIAQAKVNDIQIRGDAAAVVNPSSSSAVWHNRFR